MLCIFNKSLLRQHDMTTDNIWWHFVYRAFCCLIVCCNCIKILFDIRILHF